MERAREAVRITKVAEDLKVVTNYLGAKAHVAEAYSPPRITAEAKKAGLVSMFFFSYNCYVDGKLLIEMRNGVAGFFSSA